MAIIPGSKKSLVGLPDVAEPSFLWEGNYDFEFHNNDFATGGDPQTFSDFDQVVSKNNLKSDLTFDMAFSEVAENL